MWPNIRPRASEAMLVKPVGGKTGATLWMLFRVGCVKNAMGQVGVMPPVPGW
jgi:hypothetical protein